jgi:hypothetical protein
MIGAYSFSVFICPTCNSSEVVGTIAFICGRMIGHDV